MNTEIEHPAMPFKDWLSDRLRQKQRERARRMRARHYAAGLNFAGKPRRRAFKSLKSRST
jgi:hypothetical protein